MSKEEIFERLTEVFMDIFDNDDIKLTDKTTAADIEGWDSLTHVTLLTAVEDEFGIRFDMKTVHELKNVGDMAELIGKLAK